MKLWQTSQIWKLKHMHRQTNAHTQNTETKINDGYTELTICRLIKKWENIFQDYNLNNEWQSI